MCTVHFNSFIRHSRLLLQSGLPLILALLLNSALLSGQTRVVVGNLTQDGVSHRINQGGIVYYDYTVPQAGAMPYLTFTARGGDGGKASWKDILGKIARTGQGGQGATVTATFKIGTGAGELHPNSTLRVIVGRGGDSFTSCPACPGNVGGGGGGGTGILYLPAGADETIPSNWKILAIAGGGGGGNAGSGGRADNGRPGQSTEYGFIDSEFYNKAEGFQTYKGEDLAKIFGHNGNGGFWAKNSSGGGGSSYLHWADVSNISDWSSPQGNTNNIFCQPPSIMGDCFQSGLSAGARAQGLFQSVNGKIVPVGGSGNGSKSFGGYGCGSGGGTNDGFGEAVPGGGGGGYSGGFPGVEYDVWKPGYMGGGGGGSYFNPAYAMPGSATKIQNGTTDNPGNGFVEYLASATNPVATCDLGFAYANNTDYTLLNTGGWNLRWQHDGNLVLYQTGVGAKWASNTNTKGDHLYFQGDGNLVIRQNGAAIWASNTANDEKGGKGGRKLVLTSEGSLYITDQDGKVIWKGR